MNKENFLCLKTKTFFKNILRLLPTWLLSAWNLLVRSTKDLSAIPKKFIILMIMITAQYVNCAAANPGADAGMYDSLRPIQALNMDTSAS